MRIVSRLELLGFNDDYTEVGIVLKDSLLGGDVVAVSLLDSESERKVEVGVAERAEVVEDLASQHGRAGEVQIEPVGAQSMVVGADQA